jgi:hypothetical protein
MVALVGEPPDLRLSGGSLTLDPGHPKPDHPNLELLSLSLLSFFLPPFSFYTE